jgi:hypothetical protein
MKEVKSFVIEVKVKWKVGLGRMHAQGREQARFVK